MAARRHTRDARRPGAARPRAAEPGLHLVIGERGRILRSAPIRNAPRGVLQPPFLTPETLKRMGTAHSGPMPVELVLEVLRSDGRVLDSFGWPWTAEAFYDRPLPKAPDGVRAGRVASDQPLRILRVPIPPAAAFLLLSRSDVRLRERSRRPAMERSALALYSLVPAIRRPPSLPRYAEGLRVQPLPGPTRLVEPS